MSLSLPARWYVAGPLGRFHWRHWDDESVVYDSRSGQTHLLNALGAEALSALQGTPRGIDELAAILSELLGAEPAEAFTDQLATLVHQLHDLGLVERSRD